MSQPLHVEGHCYCGELRYSVDIPGGARPIFSLYCHCDSCRRAHAAALYQVVCIDEAWFTLRSGELQDFCKPGKRIHRQFCRTCGTRICNRFPGWRPGGRTPLAFFPNTLDEATQHALPELLRPTGHNAAGECVLDGPILRQVLAPAAD